MGFGLAFLPLIGGFLFLTNCNYFRFLSHRESGYRLLFQSAAAGLCLAIVARAAVLTLDTITPSVGELWHRLVPFEDAWTGTAMLSFLLGLFAAWALNRIYPADRGAHRAVVMARDAMELLFVESMDPTSLVEATLENRKVYIGWILNADADPHRTAVEMCPLLSGYRDKDTLRVELVTNYARVYEQYVAAQETIPDAVLQHFRVVFPTSEIKSARLFDSDAYEMFRDDPASDAATSEAEERSGEDPDEAETSGP